MSKWVSMKDRAPEPYTEVLVQIDGHRGSMWCNLIPLVAYMNELGDWYEERHPSKEPLQGVMAWKPLPERFHEEPSADYSQIELRALVHTLERFHK